VRSEDKSIANPTLITRDKIPSTVKLASAFSERNEEMAGTSINSTTALVATEESVEELARLFLRGCQSFRIDIAECDPKKAVAGPNVWRFYIKLALNQKIAELRNCLEDIGRGMGRSGLLLSNLSTEIALDIPRQSRETVPLSKVLQRVPLATSPELMPIPIGITPEGSHLIKNLNEMPHLLVGGTTGSGKTIFLYGVITALLKSHPNPSSLRLLLSTSKPEDFVFFDGIKHLEEGRVITDAIEATQLLQYYVNNALDERGKILTAARCRDIAEYNSKHEPKMAPLVVIVDEFADLADQLSGQRVNKEAFYVAIRRIAQLGRSKGIHLILCTQRPSSDLVPTQIRNLMNARVSLHVNDSIASRMILEETGAEQLQLKGDLFYKEYASLIRAQGYYVSSMELEDILNSILE